MTGAPEASGSISIGPIARPSVRIAISTAMSWIELITQDGNRLMYLKLKGFSQKHPVEH